MAKVAVHHTTTGQTLYAWFLNSAGQLWNGAAFENYLTANIDTYDVAMTEQGTASLLYEATVPALVAGQYGVIAKRRVGGAVAETDPTVGSGQFGWDGTDFTVVPSAAEVAAIQARLSPISTKTGAVVADGGNSATSFVTDLTESTNDYWKDAFLRLTSGVLINQVKKISAYNGTTKAVTVTGGFTGTPAAGVTFEVIND